MVCQRRLTNRIGKLCLSTNSGLESVLDNPGTVTQAKKELVNISGTSTWGKIIPLALRQSRVEVLPELWLALDSLAGSG
jgi:hypothetical protein